MPQMQAVFGIQPFNMLENGRILLKIKKVFFKNKANVKN